MGICGTEQDKGTKNYSAPSKPGFTLRYAPGISHTASSDIDIDKVNGEGRY